MKQEFHEYADDNGRIHRVPISKYQQGDKLLDRLTHESLTYHGDFDDEKYIVVGRNGETKTVHKDNVCLDWDRTILTKIANAWKRLTQRN